MLLLNVSLNLIFKMQDLARGILPAVKFFNILPEPREPHTAGLMAEPQEETEVSDTA